MSSIKCPDCESPVNGDSCPCGWKREAAQVNKPATCMYQGCQLPAIVGVRKTGGYCSWHQHTSYNNKPADDKRAFMIFVSTMAALSNLEKKQKEAGIPITKTLWRHDPEKLWELAGGQHDS